MDQNTKRKINLLGIFLGLQTIILITTVLDRTGKTKKTNKQKTFKEKRFNEAVKSGDINPVINPVILEITELT